MVDPWGDNVKLCVSCDTMYTRRGTCVQCRRQQATPVGRCVHGFDHDVGCWMCALAEQRELDRAAAEKDTRAHKKPAPSGTWR